jgi:type I restriction enzyme, S subunit
MQNHWNMTSFSEAVDINPSISLKKGERYPFVDMKAIDPSWRDVSFSEIREFKGGGSRFFSNDTLMARITPCLENGKISQYKPKRKKESPAFGSTEFIVIRGKKDVTDNKFAYYLTRWEVFREFAISQMTGSSGRQRVPVDSLSKFNATIPPLSEQRAIAHILGTLDEKIELNRKMNQTLESMAQALFKSWFVDFDPVIDNALAAGNDIPEELQERTEIRRALGDNRKSLPEDIQKLFPSEFEYTEEMGWVPKGWRVGRIYELCEKVKNGGTPNRSNPEYWNEGVIPWLTSGEVRQTILIKTENFISELGLKNSSAKWIPAGSTVVALYGATAGQVAFIAAGLTTNQAVCGLIPKKNYTYFNYLALERGVSLLANQARGSAQQNISKGIVEETKVVIPNDGIAEKFETECHRIFSKWAHNLSADLALSNLRDTLLPKLMSGEIRVDEAKEFVEEMK